ncbi:glycosyl hydrolase 53 family protein [Kocuria sp. CPCC 205292]|uniref:glycoside hydrolase family 53 protein n=1 Tax=Kocuria cellulosilytica TaxID=3071451 RepID=UPI0034D64E12
MTTTASASRDFSESSIEIRGADISFTLQEEAIGRSVSMDGKTQPIEQILSQHGASHVRLRVWVDPAAGTSDLESALVLAARAHKAGMKLLLDLHYSDTWADRTYQRTPPAWRGQDVGELASSVESYTEDVIAAFAAQGTPVDIVQIGNEVTLGMLWPVGEIYRQDGEHWADFARLVKAGASGAAQGNPSAPPAVMIHTDTGGDVGMSTYFFDRMLAHQVEFDYIGLTYYPFWQGSSTDLEHNLHTLADRYGKDIIIAETAYPWTLSNSGPSVVETAQALPHASEHPPTPAGQAAFFESLRRILRDVPHGHGAGFFVWEPGWLPGVNATAEVGTTHGNLTLFDWEGRGLPALAAFRRDSP